MEDLELGELVSDIKWIKQKLEDGERLYASKWVEKPIAFVMVGVAGWMLTQILTLIETAKALF